MPGRITRAPEIDEQLIDDPGGTGAAKGAAAGRAVAPAELLPSVAAATVEPPIASPTAIPSAPKRVFKVLPISMHPPNGGG
jgi:hypothetical protein